MEQNYVTLTLCITEIKVNNLNIIVWVRVMMAKQHHIHQTGFRSLLPSGESLTCVVFP